MPALTLDRQNALRDQYRRQHPGWQPATEVYEATIRDRLTPGMAVLDLGCGRGGVLEQLGTAVSAPFGIDPDGQSLVEHRLTHMPRAVALADDLPLRSGQFDAVVCSWVLEHVAQPTHVFAEVARVLRPGGFFVLLTPNARALVTIINRTLRPMQRRLVERLYGRAEADTFPVLYRANRRAALDRLAAAQGLVNDGCYQIADPTYLAFTPMLYAVSRALSHLTPPVHLVAVYRRPAVR